jgi:hypothetical protein
MTRMITATSIQACNLRVRVELVQPMRLALVGAASRAAAGGVLGLLLVEPVLFAAVGAAGAELSTSGATSRSWGQVSETLEPGRTAMFAVVGDAGDHEGRSERVYDTAGDHVAHVAGCEAVRREATEAVDFPSIPPLPDAGAVSPMGMLTGQEFAMSPALGPVGLWARAASCLWGPSRSLGGRAPSRPSGRSTRSPGCWGEAKWRGSDLLARPRRALERLTARSLEHDTVESSDVGEALSRVPGRREPVGVTGHAASASR